MYLNRNHSYFCTSTKVTLTFVPQQKSLLLLYLSRNHSLLYLNRNHFYCCTSAEITPNVYLYRHRSFCCNYRNINLTVIQPALLLLYIKTSLLLLYLKTTTKASLLLAVYLTQITLTVVPLHKPSALLTSLVLMYLYRRHSYCCAYTDITLTVVPLYKPFALSYLYWHHFYCCTYTHHSYCCTSTDITRTVVPIHTSQLLLHFCRTVLPQ